jgi:hypothetical protein
MLLLPSSFVGAGGIVPLSHHVMFLRILIHFRHALFQFVSFLIRNWSSRRRLAPAPRTGRPSLGEHARKVEHTLRYP